MIRDELRLVVDACDAYASWQMRMRGTSIRRARKSLKRIRAVLDLVRTGIDPDVAMGLRRDCGDLGRRLGPLRDRDVVRGLLGRLEEEVSGSRRRREFRLATTILAASEPNLVVRDHRAEEETVSDVRDGAMRILGELGRVDFTGVDRGLVLDRIERQWRRARSRFVGEYRPDDAEWLHDARKRVIRVQLSLLPLTKIRPAPIRRTIEIVKRIADDLGDDHDLTVLGDLLDVHRDRLAEAGGVQAIDRELEHRRIKLRNSARRRGRVAFRKAPEEVRSRLSRWWKHAARRDPGEG